MLRHALPALFPQAHSGAFLPADPAKLFWRAAQYIADHPGINKVILFGGDPLTLSTRVLQKMLTGLAEIPHVDFVRIGTHVSVTHPLRFFDNELIGVLR